MAAAVIPINSADGNGSTTDTLNTFTRLFGSLHPGGCHFAMCDGSVRFVSENVDLAAYQNTAQRKDAQVVEEF